LINIGVVTVARSDYGYYLPLLRQIEAEPNLGLCLIVGGMHLSPEFGLSVKQIEADGFEIAERVEMLLSTDTPSGIAKSVGMGVIGFSQAYARLKPDLLLLLGDRFEMLAAAIAILPFAIPIAHIAGGEATEGAIDEAIRHSITKMSHLHFVSTEPYRRRVIQLGEEPWRVTVSGAPTLDNLHGMTMLSPKELESRIGLPMHPAPLLVTFHPVTLEHESTDEHVRELFAALEAIDLPTVFTFPNADTHSSSIIAATREYIGGHKNARMVINLGSEGYFSLMTYARAMVGNSSSGIIEAASFKLPVVNIGNRQRGRLHDRNVLDVEVERIAISNAIRQAISPEFRRSLENLQNPYGDGHASERILQVLRHARLDRNLLLKPFYDLSVAG
jgi:UDP-hydrolysing UDP-N-acetyl-D-glucosamine 2-epimerase